MKTFVVLIGLLCTACFIPTQLYSDHEGLRALILSPTENPTLKVLHEATVDAKAGTVVLPLPDDVDASHLIPQFRLWCKSIQYNGVELISGQTAVDLSKPGTLVVRAYDNWTTAYTVSVVRLGAGLALPDIETASLTVTNTYGGLYELTVSTDKARADLLGTWDLAKDTWHWAVNPRNTTFTDGNLGAARLTLKVNAAKMTVNAVECQRSWLYGDFTYQSWSGSYDTAMPTLAVFQSAAFDLAQPVVIVLTGEDGSQRTIQLTVDPAP